MSIDQDKRRAALEANEAERRERSRQWAAQRFGIAPEAIEWYHSGICYDRIIVNTEEAARKVQAAAKGSYVNGGMLHGMELGRLAPAVDGKWDIMV
jgi:hypothetical protein